MKLVQSRWFRIALEFSVVLLCLVVLVAIGLLVLNWHIGKKLNAKGTREARQGVVEVAEKMRASHKPLPRDLTPEKLYQIDYRFHTGHFDQHGYSISVRGGAPRYAGTTVTYHGRPPQPFITLTVSDLSAGEWSIAEDRPARPWYWWR